MADLFYFTYNYGNSDYYSGYGVANTGTYTTGQRINAGTNELGLNGNYTIDFLISGGASSSLVGNIYTYAYYDGDTSKKSYSTLYGSQGVASGTGGLGTEFDYIFGAATGYDYFGRAYYEADAAGIALYSFTYDYGNGDYYNGYVYASDVAYQVGNSYDYNTGNNQAGFNGKYTITGATTGYDSSYSSVLGAVLVYNYYDGDTSKKSYTPLYWSQQAASGTSGLGSELDYIYSPGVSYSPFGRDYYEADAAGLALYSFTYNYGNGDYYNGYVVASDVAYQVGNSYNYNTGNNQAGFDGKYTINGASSLDASYAYGRGYVFVYNYYDGDTSKQSYTPLSWSQLSTSGTSGLGSELDYIYGGLSGYSLFGQDYYEADAQSVARYSFTYNYGNGDYYNGYVYASNAAYQVGNSYDYNTGNNQAGFNGQYTITGATTSYDSTYNSLQGNVLVYNYYDGDYSKKSYTPYYYSQNQASGTNGLGSEFDYIYGVVSGYDYFGQDYYEADVAGISLYLFTYDYSGTNRANTDRYYGYIYASDVAYQVGSTYDYSTANNQQGFNGKYTITASYTGYDAATTALNYVYVYSYYDGDYGGNYYTPFYYSQNSKQATGTSGLGSERDYIITSRGDIDLFGYDYYEADNLAA